MTKFNRLIKLVLRIASKTKQTLTNTKSNETTATIYLYSPAFIRHIPLLFGYTNVQFQAILKATTREPVKVS